MTVTAGRAVVIDVAREEIRGPSGTAAGEAGRMSVAALTAGIRAVLPAGLGDRSLLVAHPTGWGALRRTRIADAARSLAEDIELVPRAVVIARSHLGLAAGRCLVAEAAADRVDLHTLRCDGAAWEVVKSAAGTSDPALFGSEVGDDIEAFLVDAADRALAREIIAVARRATVVGRIIAVDRMLLIRFGAERRTPPITQPATTTAEDRGRRNVRLVVPALVAASVTAIAVVVGLVMSTGHDSGRGGDRAAQPADAIPSSEPDRFGRSEMGRVRLDVPSGWIRTTQPGADPALPRTTFADPVGGGRITVMQFVVRDGADRRSVASSLRARIEQRGSDDVADFEEHRTVGGRDVISYRELPGSGQPVAWHVVVGDRLQVSVGCQSGTETDIGESCDRAVGSLSIARR